MASGTVCPMLQVVRQLAEGARTQGLADDELLRQFCESHDECCFQAIVGRHGGMVLSVCRAMLRVDQDIEDAFQATFLILAAKAKSIRKSTSLASWLHGVAFRTAIKAQAEFAKRAKHEARVPKRDAPNPEDPNWSEVQRIVHEELLELTESIRAPLVLCYLQGKTQDEAAALLGVPKGTLKRFLERGRAVLRRRLERRGLGSVALLLASAWPAAIASAAVSSALMNSTVQAAVLSASGQASTGIVSLSVTNLVEGVLRAMFHIKAKMVAVLTAVLTVLGLGGAMVFWNAQSPAQSEQPKKQDQPKKVGPFATQASEQPKNQEQPKKFGSFPTKVPAGKATTGDGTKSDAEKLNGKWVSIACEMEGQKLEEYHFDPTFEGRNYTIQFGTIRMAGSFELNPQKTPKTITLNDADGSTNLGIYSINGDELRICIAEKKKPRPTAFKTEAGSGHSLLVFKRVPRETEVREVVDRFLATALAGEIKQARALAAPAVSDEQIVRFKGVAKALRLAEVYASAGPAPTSHGENTGRALVVTEEVEISKGSGKKTMGRIVLTLLKDDERLTTKGWLVWDIDFKNPADAEKDVKVFLERYPAMKKSESK